MKKLSIALAIVAAFAARALADNFDHYELIRGNVKRENGYTTLVLGLKNNSASTVTQVYVECGFYRGNELIDDGNESFTYVKPNQIGYGEVSGKGEDITRIDCRIGNVNQ